MPFFGLPLGSDAVTVHLVMLVTFESRSDQVSGSRFSSPSRSPSMASRCSAVTQSRDAARRSAKAARKSRRKKVDIKLSDSSA